MKFPGIRQCVGTESLSPEDRRADTAKTRLVDEQNPLLSFRLEHVWGKVARLMPDREIPWKSFGDRISAGLARGQQVIESVFCFSPTVSLLHRIGKNALFSKT
jgi:hypothetical protein